MVSDDKKDIYEKLNNKSKASSDQNNSSYSKTSSKFMVVPSNDRVNLYSAICTECHAEVKVNFEPTPNEPFFCDYCINNHRIHPPSGKMH